MTWTYFPEDDERADPPINTCSECGTSIDHRRRGALTCSNYCRIKRSRRLRSSS